MSHYPLFADLRNRPVLLAGAGKVACYLPERTCALLRKL